MGIIITTPTSEGVLKIQACKAFGTVPGIKPVPDSVGLNVVALGGPEMVCRDVVRAQETRGQTYGKHVQMPTQVGVR